MSYQQGKDERDARDVARRMIVKAANAGRDERLKPYSLRTIQRAVFKVRRNRLVKPEVLVAAGFNG